jgi:hypothetical protein
MNLSTHTDRNVNASAKVAPVSITRRSYRERGMGMSYGSSSGYALDKRYTTDWGQIRFRCV